jgi:hypothetical protein
MHRHKSHNRSESDVNPSDYYAAGFYEDFH